jgi:hypothetical protein
MMASDWSTGARLRRQSLWIASIVLWWILVQASVYWSAVRSEYWILLLAAALVGAVVAARGTAGLLASGGWSGGALLAGLFIFAADPDGRIRPVPLSVYVAAMVLWLVRRVGKRHRVLGPLEWQVVGCCLAAVTAAFDPGIGAVDPAPRVTRIAFRGVSSALFGLSAACFVIDVARAFIVRGPFTLDEIEAADRGPAERGRRSDE